MSATSRSIDPWPRLVRAALALAACVWFVSGADAAGIRLGIDREVFALGDSANLRITIDGGNGQEQPQIPDTPGLRFTRIGSNMSFSFANGRQNVMAESVYTVTATRVGNYTIGPISAQVGGRTVRSEPLALRVVQVNDPAAARSDGLDQVAFLRLQLPDRPVYVGETFVVEIHLYALGSNLKQVPVLQADGFTLGKLQEGGQEGNIRTNNRIYSRAKFLQPVTAARSGKLELQAANCILDVMLSRRGGGGGAADFFDEAFFGLRETKRLTLASPPATLDVLPLPAAGVPAGFSGAVGDFKLQLTATPTNARAGDPITVQVDIEGQGNFDSVQWNEPSAWKGFRVYPANATFQTDDPMGMTGTKRFEQVVTPESTALQALPAATFSYFSPAARAYKTLVTRAVPLVIAPGSITPALPAPPGGSSSGAHEAKPPELAPLRHQLGSWSNAIPADATSLILALTGLPWLAWLGWRAAISARRRFGADGNTLRRRALEASVRTGLEALRALATAGDSDGFFTQLFRILQESVAMRSGLPPASITEGDLESVLRPSGVDAATLDALHQLFQRCNHARYAPVRAPADLDVIRQEAAQAVQRLQSNP